MALQEVQQNLRARNYELERRIRQLEAAIRNQKDRSSSVRKSMLNDSKSNNSVSLDESDLFEDTSESSVGCGLFKTPNIALCPLTLSENCTDSPYHSRRTPVRSEFNSHIKFAND